MSAPSPVIRSFRYSCLISWLSVLPFGAAALAGGPSPSNPVLFVTQLPIAADFATIGSTFANHGAHASTAGRGGDLYIRYPDGELRNLTREAGFGEAGVFQGASSIAVRDPHVHPDGARALFSMVVGAATERYVWTVERWQIYEVTGLGQGGAAVITPIANQPQAYNNLTPVYSPDGRIVFTSDRPRGGEAHLYPQHDEYESTATNTGLWALDPGSGALQLLDHAPSGDFTPIVDSFGRLVFSRWDHLQRDQQADATGNPYGTFDWADEGAAAPTSAPSETFPEPRADDRGAGTFGHRFNHFFPWMILPDGSGLETLNHVGRHELHNYFNRSLIADTELEEFIAAVSGRTNPRSIQNLFQLVEDPTVPGAYVGVDAPEFGTHAAGQVVRLAAPPALPADGIVVDHLTHPDTASVVGEGETPPATHSGHYRDPLPLSDGSLLASHSAETRYAENEGTRTSPDPRYDFRLKRLVSQGGYRVAGTMLTPGAGIVRTIQYWDPDELVSYSGPMWELQPVEVRPRPQPPLLTSTLPAPEVQVFAEVGVDPAELEADLRSRGLALIVSRDVTTRDVADRQQPYNLRVPGGTMTVGSAGPPVDVAYLQLFQGDQVRGIGGAGSPRVGRRLLARPLHHPEAIALNLPTDGPDGSVAIATDGSQAAFVPAGRALTWQLTAPDGTPVVRERYWLTFRAGEIRVCTSCHGLNREDQAGRPEPVNPPQALRSLLERWSLTTAGIFSDGFESGNVAAWSWGP